MAEERTGPYPPFEPGRSGNPSGRPKKTPEMREAEELARKRSPDAMRRLIALMDCEDPHAAIKAANAVLDRAFGKPVQAVSGPDGGPIQIEASAELARQQLAAMLARGTQTVEAHVIEERPALPDPEPEKK